MFVVFTLASRWHLAHLSGKKALAAKLARFALVAGPQALIQLALFFTLPFYVRAANSPLEHGPFVVLVVLAAGVTLWDPWYLALAQKRVWGPLLHGFANFVGLNCVLPMLGLSHQISLWMAGGVAALGPPLLAWFEQKQRFWAGFGGRAWLATFLVACALFLGAARLVPPAPLRLADAAFGTGLANRALLGRTQSLSAAPPELWCWSAIEAPRGLKDKLFHVWRHDGQEVERIAVDVSGGREQGFRTWTKKRQLGPKPAGWWTCRVETALGQRLGQATLRIQ